ncbi:MAG: M20/M25/M40 family metallo-hydrolase [Salinirussus sp.]
MLSLEAVDAEMQNREEEWLGILSNLISIPSENPPGDTTEVFGYYEDLLADRGVPYEIISPKDHMPNIVAHIEGQMGQPENGPHLGYNGHLDTLPRRGEGKWKRDPFSGAIEDGKVHGRGASDMYAGFVASLASFLFLYENRDDFEGQVTLTAVSDEESGGQWGSQYIVEKFPEYRGEAVISGEPSSNKIVRFAERGAAWLELTVDGKSAHTSSIPPGLNAIEVLIDLLRDIKDLEGMDDLIDLPEKHTEVIRGSKRDMDSVYGDGATDQALSLQVNIGTIDGGEAVNLVAETARAHVDIRLPLGTTTADVVCRIQAIADDHPGDIHIECYSHRDPTASNIDDPLFEHLLSCAERVRGEQPSLSCGLAFTDCAFYRQYGVDCAVYGPDPHNVGSQNEYVRIDDFMEVVRTQAMASAAYMNGD